MPMMSELRAMPHVSIMRALVAVLAVASSGRGKQQLDEMHVSRCEPEEITHRPRRSMDCGAHSLVSPLLGHDRRSTDGIQA